MRISDWSSDVCSSDLPRCRSAAPLPPRRSNAAREAPDRSAEVDLLQAATVGYRQGSQREQNVDRPVQPLRHQASDPRERTEEHTSELQSLMRISFAVFIRKHERKASIIYKVLCSHAYR